MCVFEKPKALRESILTSLFNLENNITHRMHNIYNITTLNIITLKSIRSTQQKEEAVLIPVYESGPSW